MQVLGTNPRLLFGACAAPEGLTIIDQHAAHERVAFETLRRQLETGKVETAESALSLNRRFKRR